MNYAGRTTMEMSCCKDTMWMMSQFAMQMNKRFSDVRHDCSTRMCRS